MNAEPTHSPRPETGACDDVPSTLLTLRALGILADGVRCQVRSNDEFVDAGLHPAVGGSKSIPNGADMLLESLVACAGVTLGAVAKDLGIVLRDAVIRAEADLDVRGMLGVSKEAPVGFQNVRLRFFLDTAACDQEVATLLRLTERYCLVYQTLAKSPTLEVSRRIHQRN